MNLPPSLPIRTHSPFGIAALALGGIGGALSAWMTMHEAGSTPEELIGSAFVPLAGLAIAMLGAILALASAALRGHKRSVSAAAAVLNVALLAVFVKSMAERLPPAISAWRERLTSSPPEGSSQSGDAGLKVARAPIPQDEKALTSRDVYPHYFSWGDRNLRAVYDAQRKKDVRWDDAVHEVFTESIQTWIGMPDKPLPTARRVLSRKILALGCDDPAVLFLASEAEEPKSAAARDLLARALAGLPSSGYPAGILFLATIDGYAADSRDATSAGAGPRSGNRQPGLDALRRLVEEGPFGEDDQWFWDYLFSKGSCRHFLADSGSEAFDILDAAPGVPEWMKHRLKGTYEVDAAWKERGSGWANEVSKDGWKGFERHVDRAAEELTVSWGLNAVHPSAATDMITVAMARSDLEQMRLWFDRAVRARFDYSGAYKNMRWGLRERWLGSKNAMIAFGVACADTKRYDTSVPWELQFACHDQSSDSPNEDDFFAHEAPWPALKAMFEGYIAEPSQAARRNYYRTEYAVLAFKSRHPAECREQLEALSFQFDPEAALGWNFDSKKWIEQASAESGPEAGHVAAAKAAALAGNRERALAELREASALVPPGDPGNGFIERYASTLHPRAPLPAKKAAEPQRPR